MIRCTLIMAFTLLLWAASGCTPDESPSADARADSERDAVALGVSGQRQAATYVVVTLDQCPDDVQTTIKSKLNGGTIKEIERTTDHSEVLYEVDVLTADGVVEFDVAANGEFRGFEEDDDDADDEEDEGDDEDDDDENEEEVEIPLSEVPQNVKDAAIKAVPGLVLEEAARETEGDAVIYELEGEADGKEYEVEVSAGGEVLEIEEDEEDDEDDDDDDEDDDEGEDDDD